MAQQPDPPYVRHIVRELTTRGVPTTLVCACGWVYSSSDPRHLARAEGRHIERALSPRPR